MKRILKNCLSLILVLTILSGPGYAGLNEVDFSGIFEVKANAASESDLTFALNDNGKSYSVSACNESAKGELLIPSTYNGLPVTSIGSSAFYYCEILTSVTIPDSVTSIGERAFVGCTSLTSITIPDSVISIGNSAFYNTAYYKNPSNWIDFVLYIGNHLIEADTTIYGNYVIENGTKTIANDAFRDCANLTSITIPDSVTSIGYKAFEDCSGLTSVHITDIASWCNISFGDSYSNPLNYATNLYLNGELVTDLVIPDSVTSVGSSAFECCASLTSITIPDSVTSIGDGAFFLCEKLTSVTIPDSVTSIGDSAFEYCKSLTSVTIPDSVTSIGRWAFYDCTSLTSVHITDIASWCNISFSDGSNPLVYAKNLYLNGELVTDLVIPDSVTSIGEGAFWGCKSLTSITIPDSVTSVGDDAFYYCTSLTSVTIPNSVTSIGNFAFEDCRSLTSVTIGNSVTSIGEGAFEYCTNLTSITIPNSVTSIGECAFDDCGSLEYVFYTGSETGWANITIGTGNTQLTELPIHYNATGHTSSDWITDKNATVDAAGSRHKECTVCKAVLEKETIPQLKCAAPKLTKVESTSSGVKLTWGKTAGADSYNIYRKTYSNGKWSGWSTIKTGATGTTYTDTTAKSGVYYIYTVRAKNEAGLSGFNSTGLKIKFLATPKLSSVANGSGKVTVKWGKVTGASGYTVYRKTYSNGKWSGWSKIGTTKNTYYNDAKVSGGKNYKYTVRATSGDCSSYYNTSGIQIKYLAGPKISSASSRRDGILINWNKINGASGYYVYRKTSSGDWKKIATVKGNTKIKYLDETPRKGVTYQYRVKAYSGNYTSTYANTYKITCKY